MFSHQGHRTSASPNFYLFGIINGAVYKHNLHGLLQLKYTITHFTESIPQIELINIFENNVYINKYRETISSVFYNSGNNVLCHLKITVCSGSRWTGTSRLLCINEIALVDTSGSTTELLFVEISRLFLIKV
jgi:hypothetical protein